MQVTDRAFHAALPAGAPCSPCFFRTARVTFQKMEMRSVILLKTFSPAPLPESRLRRTFSWRTLLLSFWASFTSPSICIIYRVRHQILEQASRRWGEIQTDLGLGVAGRMSWLCLGEHLGQTMRLTAWCARWRCVDTPCRARCWARGSPAVSLLAFPPDFEGWLLEKTTREAHCTEGRTSRRVSSKISAAGVGQLDGVFYT